MCLAALEPHESLREMLRTQKVGDKQMAVLDIPERVEASLFRQQSSDNQGGNKPNGRRNRP
jgi:hypothetical protein